MGTVGRRSEPQAHRGRRPVEVAANDGVCGLGQNRRGWSTGATSHSQKGVGREGKG